MKTEFSRKPAWPKGAQALGSAFIGGYAITNLFNAVTNASDQSALVLAAWAFASASFAYLTWTSSKAFVRRCRENRGYSSKNRKRPLNPTPA